MLTFLFQVQGDVTTALTRKTKIVDVVANMATDLVAEEIKIIPHKFMTIPTPRRIRV